MPFAFPSLSNITVHLYLLPKFSFTSQVFFSIAEFIFPQVSAAHPFTFSSALHLPSPFCFFPPMFGGPGVCGLFVLVFEDGWKRRGEEGSMPIAVGRTGCVRLCWLSLILETSLQASSFRTWGW